jgi:DNA-binding response OmpR family regulator
LRDIPVIMLSSKDGLFDRARGRLVGSDEYLTKPFTKDTLLRSGAPAPGTQSALIHRDRGSMPINKILIVDDSPTERFYLTDMLRKSGYEVITAETGELGVAVAKQEKPDLILMDVVMPG